MLLNMLYQNLETNKHTYIRMEIQAANEDHGGLRKQVRKSNYGGLPISEDFAL